MKRVLLVISVHVLTASAVCADSRDIFWKYTTDRYNRPILKDKIEVPGGVSPYDYLAWKKGYESWMIRREGHVVFLAEQSSKGEVLILGFHKIGHETNFSLTPERFRKLLKYINNNGWYLIADHQYLSRDFSRVPTGLKPIVMGADDASYGIMIYQTHGKRLTGRVKRVFGRPVLNRNSMVAILEKYAKKENNRINFTFYVSFDAIPFRQLGDHENPGFPYPGIPVVEEKIRYLDKNFILGLHTLSHKPVSDTGLEFFIHDALLGWELIDEYAGGEARSVQTIAYPYGISETVRSELKATAASLTRNDRQLIGGFDFNNKTAQPPGLLDEVYSVPRLNVDNRNWKNILHTLENADAVIARRVVIWETDRKKLPPGRWSAGAAPSDEYWILVKKRVNQIPVERMTEGTLKERVMN